MSNFGKILVVNSQTVYKNNATGITLRSILSTTPTNKVMEVYRYDSDDRVNQNLGFQSVQIPPKSMPLNYIFRKLMKNDNYKDRDIVEGSPYGENVQYNWKQVVKIVVKAVLENSWIIPNKKFIEQVDAFSPDYIYTLSASFYVNKWVLYFAKRYNIPIVVHYMDNWRETIYTQDKRTKWLNSLFERQIENMETKMKCGLTISELMKCAYSQKYHKKYLALMNTVKVQPYREKLEDKIIIIYAGGMHLKRNEVLKSISDFIASKSKLELHIYTSNLNIETYGKEFKGENTFFHCTVPHEKICKIYENADILLHIESFDEKVIQYTKYSMSTKIPEYMMAGRPIICYAPHSIAAYQYVVECKAGIGVENLYEFEKALDLLSDSEIRKQFGSRGYLNAKKNHSVEALKETMKEVFCSEEKISKG